MAQEMRQPLERGEHDHFVTRTDRWRGGGGADVLSGAGHSSPWRRAIRRIHTWASIIVSMRCRRFFRDFMPRCCQLRRRT